jgi:hypothetical protein
MICLPPPGVGEEGTAAAVASADADAAADSLAQAKAGAGLPCSGHAGLARVATLGLHCIEQRAGAEYLTREVCTHVHNAGWAFFHAEHGVETCNAVGLGWRHIESAAQLAETARTHPANAIL